MRRKTRWLLALDTGLFEAPLAALREDGRYLVELHAIQTIPSAGAWIEAASTPRRPRNQLFVGVGDPIYNAADPRLPSRVAGVSGALVLPRLVASAGEVEGMCAILEWRARAARRRCCLARKPAA